MSMSMPFSAVPRAKEPWKEPWLGMERALETAVCTHTIAVYTLPWYGTYFVLAKVFFLKKNGLACLSARLSNVLEMRNGKHRA